MNQEQYNTIVKIIQSGAPALANELCSALANLVAAYNNLNEKCKCDKEEKDGE